MDKITEYVAALDDETRHDIIKEYEKFEELGSTGDTSLRNHAAAMLKNIGHTDMHYITMGMRELAAGVWRYYYEKHYGQI